MALHGSKTLYAAAQNPGLPATLPTEPGAQFWFIWRRFLSDSGSILFKLRFCILRTPGGCSWMEIADE